MISLFRYENYEVIVDPEALLLKPFKKIDARDRSASKNKSKMELGFIYFYADPRSDYLKSYSNEGERVNKIKEGEGFKDDWVPDAAIWEAIDFYKEFAPISAKLIDSSRRLIDRFSDYLDGIDFNEKDDKGKPIFRVNEITSAIKQIPDLSKSLMKAEKSLFEELVEDSSMRGEKAKSLFEDGISFNHE